MIAHELTGRNRHGTRRFVVAVTVMVTVARGGRLAYGNSAR